MLIWLLTSEPKNPAFSPHVKIHSKVKTVDFVTFLFHFTFPKMCAEECEQRWLRC